MVRVDKTTHFSPAPLRVSCWAFARLLAQAVGEDLTSLLLRHDVVPEKLGQSKLEKAR